MYDEDETFEVCLECFTILIDTDDEDPTGKRCNECYALETEAFWEYMDYDE